MSAAETTKTQSQASGSSFYAAMRLLPGPERAAMFAIYAFCREVDDIADDEGPSPAERRADLEAWRGRVEALYAGAAAEGAAGEAQVDLLYRQIGQLKVENDFLARRLGK